MDETPHNSQPVPPAPSKNEGNAGEGLAYSAEDEYRPAPQAPAGPPAWQDGSLRIGIHTSIAGDIAQSLEIAHGLGANALQIFSASPRMWNAGSASTASTGGPGRERFSAVEMARFRARREELQLGPLVVHANYLINLASPDRVLRVRSIQAFHDELIRAVALGADYLVVHPGASRGGEQRKAAEAVAQSLQQAARGIKLGSLRILLENTAGQGSALGATFSELKFIMDLCRELPLGVCIDTAHMFAAGFNIREAEGLEKTLQAIQSTFGLARVFVIHCNDSKAPLGSHVDRHEHIGKGKIGLEAFRRILNHPMLAPAAAGQQQEPATGGVGRAFILETPIDRPGDDLKNVRTLWKLVGKHVPAASAAPRDGFRKRASKRKKAAVRKSSGKKGKAVRRAKVSKRRRGNCPWRSTNHNRSKQGGRSCGTSGAFRAVEDSARPKYYVLEMFPYPSGTLHMGHVRNYTIGDVVARYKRHAGLQRAAPDRAGTPSACRRRTPPSRTGIHPREWTHDNIAAHEGAAAAPGLQLRLGAASSPPACPNTTAGTSGSSCRCSSAGWPTARRASVNWCPKCDRRCWPTSRWWTARCWRCGTPVEQRELEQWFFRITAYADELLDEHRSSSTRLAGESADDAAQLDRPVRRRARCDFPLDGPRRAASRSSPRASTRSTARPS